MCDVIFMLEFTRLYMRYAVLKYQRYMVTRKLKTVDVALWVYMLKEDIYRLKRKSCKRNVFSTTSAHIGIWYPFWTHRKTNYFMLSMELTNMIIPELFKWLQERSCSFRSVHIITFYPFTKTQGSNLLLFIHCTIYIS